MAIKELETKFYDSYFTTPIQSIIGPTFPLLFGTIRQQQQNNPSLQHLPTSSPSQFEILSIHDTKILHYRRFSTTEETTPSLWRIFIPTHLVPITISYYHRILHHPGSTRLYNAISNHFYFRSMRSQINQFTKKCDIRQRVKGPFPKLGHLPLKSTELKPWQEVQIDLVGPWTFQIPPNGPSRY